MSLSKRDDLGSIPSAPAVRDTFTMNKLIFFRELLKNWRQTSSVTPSSPFLIRKMLKRVDFGRARLIVELGPGTGPITREILKRMRSDATLIVFELNETFCGILRKINDPRLSVRRVSAQNISTILRGERADYIISGLPLAVFDKKVVRQIFGEVKKHLKPGGAYAQFQYSLASLKTMRANFPEVRTSFVPMNIPPAFVYYASCRSR